VSEDRRTFEVNGIIPDSFTWKLTGPRSADELELKLRYIDMPFDPRLVRACEVDLFFGTVTAEDYAAGIAGGNRSVGGEGNESLNVIPDTFVDSLGRERSNLRFQGWTDEFEAEWNDDGDQVISLKCRDATHLFTLIDAPSGLTISPDLPLDKAIAEYLAQFPTFEGTRVEYRGLGEPPVYKSVVASTAHQPKLGPQVAKGGGATGGDKFHVWDYIYDICAAVGHVARIEGSTLIVQQVRQLLGTAALRTDDPYIARTASGIVCSNRTLVYGRNVSSLKVKRQFTKKAPTNVEVRSYWPERKKLLVSRYPDSDAERRVAMLRPGDDTHDKKWHVITLPGITDQETLHEVARAAYEMVGRNEIGVSIKTFDLAAFGGDNDDPDLLDLRCGDTVRIEVDYNDRDGEGNSLQEIEARRVTIERNADLLKRLGFQDQVAYAYAEAYVDAGFLRDFRLRELTVKWDTEQGPEVSIEAANYIVARVGQKEPEAPTDTSKERQDLVARAQARTRLPGA
jgi:hypothetical protein